MKERGGLTPLGRPSREGKEGAHASHRGDGGGVAKISGGVVVKWSSRLWSERNQERAEEIAAKPDDALTSQDLQDGKFLLKLWTWHLEELSTI